MAIKATFRIFFAIPYDAATRVLYDEICRRLKKKFPGIECVIGKDEVQPSKKYADIASFKAQNTDLFTQFVVEIRRADIVVADLTHNNPNVHVELGIALSINKNVLRVTGRGFSELGFDIRNLDTAPYKNSDDLESKIVGYVEMYREIKSLGLSETAGAAFTQFETEYVWPPNGESMVALNFVPTAVPVMKDGAVQFDFEFLESRSDDDWAGIFLRSAEHPMFGSCLIYFRRNGLVELAEYPGQIVPEKAKKRFSKSRLDGKKTALIELEGDSFAITMDGKRESYEGLRNQLSGRAFAATYFSRIKFGNVKVVCRDTINPV